MAKLIASGAWVMVTFNEIASGATTPTAKVVLLATNCSFDEDWRIQEANVLGYLGPVALDTQGYSCSITIGAFLTEDAASAALVRTEFAGGVSLASLMPLRDDVQTAGIGKKFASVVFTNIADASVLVFNDCVIASNGMQASPNAYVGTNMRLMARERVLSL